MTLVVDIILRLLMWGWREARLGERIMCMSYTPGGDIISAGGSEGSVFFMSAQTGEKILCPLNAHSDWVRAVSWSPCGKWLASGGDDKKINIYDAQTFQVKRSLNGHSR